MVIQLFSNANKRGYLPKVLKKSIAPFFAGGNIAFRRAVLDDIGLFDETLRTGEDVDICIRTQDTDWDLYFNPDLRIQHFQRKDLRALAKQWFDYGWYHAHLFKKHNPPGVEVLLLNKSPRAELRYHVLYYANQWPVHAFVFLTSFSLMHAFAGLAALTALPAPPVAAACAAAATVAAVAYFKEDFVGKTPFMKKLQYLGVRYLVNGSLILGSLLGGLELGYLYLDGTLWKKITD